MSGKVYELISGADSDIPPIWLMRQAGRYLPEYRELRTKAPSFIDFCLNPNLVTEATLQPINRFGFDAAILFSDILLLPHFLGQNVSFESGKGPILSPVVNFSGEFELRNRIDDKVFDPVIEAISRIKSKLHSDTSLIGFCGAPWTVASYMIAGGSTPDQGPARVAAYCHPVAFQSLIDLLIDVSVQFLGKQIEAGVDVVQIFDSWAGVLPTNEFKRWCLDPVTKISDRVKEKYPNIKVIVFSRGVGWNLKKIAAVDSVDCLSLDTSVDLSWVMDNISAEMPVQGNLDPIALLAGDYALDRAVDHILNSLKDRRFIFNLGHGILPSTPIENVHQLVNRIRK